MHVAHQLEQARAALKSGARELISPPFAACHAGVGFYAAMVKELKKEFPAFELTLCCGDDAAIAHDALRLGFTRVVCSGASQELRDIAKAMKAELLPEYPARAA